jgi:hypothetical protein
MKKTGVIIAIFVPLIGFINSCKHLPEELNIIPNNKDTTKVPVKRPCSPDTVYYQKDIQPIFSANCTGSGCHSGSSPADNLDLSSFAKARSTSKIKPYDSDGSKVYQALTDGMPPAGPLSSDKIALIKKWIDQGAKDLWCDDMNKPCDTVNVTFSKTITPILATNCISCHGSSGGVTLTNYNGVKTVVTNGKLWNAINHLSGAQKAMPNSTTKLSNCNLRQIKIWIDAGAPNN